MLINCACCCEPCSGTGGGMRPEWSWDWLGLELLWVLDEVGTGNLGVLA